MTQIELSHYSRASINLKLSQDVSFPKIDIENHWNNGKSLIFQFNFRVVGKVKIEIKINELVKVWSFEKKTRREKKARKLF